MQATARTGSGRSLGRFWRGGGTVGRPSIHSMRTIWDGIQYQATAGCPWRMLPTDFPPFTTVQYHFYRWRDSGVLFVINEALVAASRIVEGRDAAPTAAIIDSQSVQTTESGGPAGYDAGKKIKGRKRHIITDSVGHLLDAMVHTRPTSRTVMVRLRSSRACGTAIQASSSCLPMAATPARSCEPPSLTSRASPSTSSNGPTVWQGSLCSPNDGWSSGPSPGSIVADASPRLGKPPSPRQKPGCSSLPSAELSDSSHAHEKIRPNYESDS